MDVVYLCRPGSNEELRFSLRSLRNLGDADRVWIFGDAPRWVTDQATVVRMPRRGSKFDICLRNLTAACEHPEVSDPFVLMNDDFYIIKPIPTVPVLHRGTVYDVLAEYEDKGISSTYTDSMLATVQTLEDAGYTDVLSFELHTPLPVTKAGMLEAIRLRSIDRWNNRTAYGAVAGITGDYSQDVKLYTPDDPMPSGPFASTSDLSIGWHRQTLADMFPSPSIYEKPRHGMGK